MHLRPFLILIFSISLLHGFAQNEKDSLSRLFSQQTGIERAQTLIRLSDRIVYASPAKALEYAVEAMEIAEKLQNEPLRYKALKARGYAFGYAGQIEQSINDMQEGLAYYRQIPDSARMAEAISDIGYLNELLANYEVALDLYQQALAIREKINDEKGIAYSLNNIGALYWHIHKSEDAFEFYNKAIAYFEKAGLKEELAVSLGNLGVLYSDLKQWNLAFDHLNRALKINRLLGNTIYEAKNLNNIGKILYEQFENDSASICFQSALVLQESIGDPEGSALSHYNLGLVYLRENQYDEALGHFIKTISIGEKYGGKELVIKSIGYCSDIYYKTGEYRLAYENLSKAKELSDTVFSLRKAEQIEELKTRYETEKNRLENENLKQTNMDNLIIIRQQQILLLLIVGVACLMALTLFFLLQRQRLLDKRKAIELEQKLLRSQMNPHFIFNTITLAQSFILGKSAREAVNMLSSFATLMRLILENSAHEFIPFEKEIQTIQLYLELQHQRYNDRFRFELNIDPQLNDLDLFVPPMMAQPFIENAIEHGFDSMEPPGLIVISYSWQDKMIRCEVDDNGIGIGATAGASKNQHSYGKEITQQRIQILEKKHKQKSKLELTDKKTFGQKGTHVRLTLPVLFQKPEHHEQATHSDYRR